LHGPVLSAFFVLKTHHCNLIDVILFTIFSPSSYPLVLVLALLNTAVATVLCSFGEYKKEKNMRLSEFK